MRVTIAEFPAYSVDEQGNVFREGREEPIKHSLTRKGYATVNLSMKGKSMRVTVHRLVLEAFVGKRTEGMHGSHLDGNKLNNSISNLAWVTPHENEAHKALHGTKALGERNGAHKLSEEQIRIIRAAKAKGPREWGAKRLAEMFGVDPSTISRAADGRHWIGSSTPAVHGDAQ